MADIIKIPYLNPLQFRPYPGGKFACDLIPSFEQKAVYIQKFQKGDILKFQVQLLIGNWNSISYRVLDESLKEVSQFTGGLTGVNGDYNIWSVRSTDNILNLPSGIYFIELNIVVIVEGANVSKRFLTEPFEIVDELPESLLIEYSHDGNEFDVAFFPTGNPEDRRFFQLRVEGGITSDGFSPASKDTFYIDQVRDVVMLNSIPFNVYKFTFGPGGGIPNWMADKINRILSLAYVEINGRQYVKNEGAKFEAIREKGYPFAGWQIELVTDNVYSISEGQGSLLGDFNPDYNNDYF
jgi:hypothetical protein